MTQPRRPFGNRPQLGSIGQTGPTPSERVTAALDTINGAAARLRGIRQQQQAVTTDVRRRVSTEQDPNLTAQGRLNAIREGTVAARQTATADLGALRDELERAEAAIDGVVQANWPAPVPGVEGLLGRQALWARNRQLIDAGVLRLSALINEADDVELLYALQEEAPIWARAQGATADTVETLEQMIDLRMAQVAGGDESSEVDLTAAFQARATLHALEPLLAQAEAEANGTAPFGTGLLAAVGSAMAQRTVQAALQPITRPDGSVL